MRTATSTTLALGILLALVPLAQADHVSVFDDAEGSLLAVSVFGNASCHFVGNDCVAISVLGNSTGGFLAVSGTGNATSCTWFCAAASGTGDAEAAAPFSVTGTCRDHSSEQKCIDVRVFDDADGFYVGVSVLGNSSFTHTGGCFYLTTAGHPEACGDALVP